MSCWESSLISGFVHPFTDFCLKRKLILPDTNLTAIISVAQCVFCSEPGRWEEQNETVELWCHFLKKRGRKANCSDSELRMAGKEIKMDPAYTDHELRTWVHFKWMEVRLTKKMLIIIKCNSFYRAEISNSCLGWTILSNTVSPNIIILILSWYYKASSVHGSRFIAFCLPQI